MTPFLRPLPRRIAVPVLTLVFATVLAACAHVGPAVAPNENLKVEGIPPIPASLATEVAPDGVTVNSIQPGSHLTDRLRNLHGEQVDALRADIPVGQLGDAADFGAAAAFLCSEQARFITGTSLLVDGGASRGLL